MVVLIKIKNQMFKWVCKMKGDSLHYDDVAKIHENQYQTLPPAETKEETANQISAFNPSRLGILRQKFTYHKILSS